MDVIKKMNACDLQHIWTVFVCVVVYDVSGSAITVPAPGFSKQHSSYTYVTGVLLTRQQAAYACDIIHGGYLVRINTDQEESDMISVITELSIAEHFWIGLQWTQVNGSNVLVWDDGNCTNVDVRDNYHDDKSKVFNFNEQCFLDHGTDDPTWEKWTCTNTQHYVCQNTSISFQPVGATFYVIVQNGSNKTSCQDICLSLIDCFVTSAISNACIVGLATLETATYAIRTDSIRINAVLNDTMFKYYKLSSVNTSTPPPCTRRREDSTSSKKLSIKDYTILKLNETYTSCAPCSQQSAPVSTVYVTGVRTTTRIVPTTVVVMSSTASCNNTEGTVTKELLLTSTTLVVMTSTARMTQLMTSTTITTELVTSTTTTTELVTSTLFASSGCPLVNSSTTVQQLDTSLDWIESSVEVLGTTQSGEALSFHDFTSLLLDKSNTSLAKRKKISAENKVLSSVVIGGTLTVFFLSFVALFLVADFGRLVLDVQMMMLKNIPRLG